MALKIVATMYDVNTVEFAVKDMATGRYIAEGCRDYAEAQAELDDYQASMDAMAAGPFSNQMTARMGR